MRTQDSLAVRRLEGLELRVSELQSLVLKLVKWTNFQEDVSEDEFRDDKERDDKTKISEMRCTSLHSNSTKNTANTGRRRSGPKSKVKRTPDGDDKEPGCLEDSQKDLKQTSSSRKKGMVAKKSTSGVPKPNLMVMNPPDALKTPIFEIKEESINSEEFVLCPSSPVASVGDTSFTFEIQDTDQDLYNNDTPFSAPSSEEDEDIPTEDEEISADDNFNSSQKTNLKRKRTPGPKSSKDKPKRIYKYRGPKLFVQPLSSRIKPPFVSLNRIDDNTLKEKYGIEGPRPKKWPCPVCDEKFTTAKEMWSHKKIHPKVYKRYTCEFCGKVHASKYKHFDHVNTHTGARPHLCEICGYAGGSRSGLRSHLIQMHFETEKKFQCDVCSAMMKTKASLRTHMKLMHSEPGEALQLPCDECGSVFKAENKLKRHKKEIHAVGRRFQCPMCDKSFKRPQHLAAHKLRHDAGIKRQRRLKEEYDNEKRKKASEKSITTGGDDNEIDTAVGTILPDPLYIGVADEDVAHEEQETQNEQQVEQVVEVSSRFTTPQSNNSNIPQNIDVKIK